MGLLLGKEVILDLRKRVITNFLKLAAQLIVLLFKLANVVVFEGKLAGKLCNFLLLLDKLLLIFFFKAISLGNRLACVELSIPEIILDIFHVRHGFKTRLQCLILVCELDDLSLQFVSLELSLHLNLVDALGLLGYLHHQVLHLLLLLLRELRR